MKENDSHSEFYAACDSLRHSGMRYLLGLACGLPLIAAVPDKVLDRFTPAPYDQQRIGGILGERLRVNLESRLLRVDEKGILEGFQNRPGKQDWIGEHAGKFLDAAANTFLYSGDQRLKALMDRIARELIATQKEDGYLGTYTDDKRWTSWDVWVHKYDLIGLLRYHQITGNRSALDASKKIGDLLVRTFGEGPGQRDIIQSGTHRGMAATSVLEPMVMLYRVTADPKYLDFCYYLVRSWDQPNGPKIFKTLNETGSVFKTANAKAYEMLSNLVGLLDLYRITGDRRYLSPVLAAWQDIVTNRLYLTGTASSREHFQDDNVLPGEDSANVGEGCVTVTWLQLNWHLLRLTGESRYADQLERTIYNQLLAAQDPRNGNICYFQPLNGRKNPTPGINCCVSSEPRGISIIPALAWGRRDDGVAVLLYVPGTVNLDKLQLRMETVFPGEGTATLHVSGSPGQFPLYLRVPAWTSSYTAALDGKVYHGKPGEFLRIEKNWNGDEIISIQMDLTVHAISGAESYPHSVAVQRGPQILALEESLNPEVIDVQAAGPASTQPDLTDSSKTIAVTWTGEQLYAMRGQVAGKPRTLFLVPFMDARVYRIWLNRP